MRTLEEIKRTVETGLGRFPCDLKLANVQLVNVFSGEIYPTDIYIQNKRVVSIEPGLTLEAEKNVDCGGAYAVPGFIDSHMHFESTMLSPEALATVVVPQGTTTLCADLMEIANVAGEEGLRAMLTCMDRLPYRMLIEVSSRVPTAPGLETTGAELGSQQVAEIMDWPESISLGELDPSKILFVKEEYLQKIADTLSRRKIVNGHAIGRLGQELNVYASSGISDDHECVTPEELLSRLRVGMRVLVREGSTERNVDALIGGVLKLGCSTENLCFCTDDKHAGEIMQEGHINYNVRRAIALGMEPMQAIQMASINAARHFRIDDEVGSITPGRLADILLVDDLTKMEPKAVYFEGTLVDQRYGALQKAHYCRVFPLLLERSKGQRDYGARYRPDRRADHQSRSDPHASGEAGGNPARSVAGYFEAGRCGALRKDRRCGRGLCAGLYAEKRRAGIFHEPRPPQHCDRWRQRQRYGDCCQRGCPPAWRTDRGLRRQRDGLHVLADRRLDERMWRRRGDAPSRRHE